MTVPTLLLSLAAIGLLAALLLLWRGWRGRIVGDHPHCRRCGFDLFGATPDATTRCPECGAWVGVEQGWDRRTVRVGRRERRRRALGWGLTVGFISGALLILFGGMSATGFDANRHKPVWLLAWEADGRGPGADSAAYHLATRARAGALSPEQLRSLTAAFLDDQADLARPWVRAKGDLIEEVQAAGKLAPADWLRYIHQAGAAALEVRPRVRHAGPVPIRVQLTRDRLGTGASGVTSVAGGTWWGLSFSVIAQHPDGTVSVLGQHRNETIEGQQPGRSFGGMMSTVIELDDAPRRNAGGLPVRYGVTIELGVANLPPAPRPLPAWPAHVVPLDVAPPGEPTVSPRPNAEMADLVRRTLHLSDRLSGGFNLASSTRPANAVEFRIETAHFYPADGSAHGVQESEMLWIPMVRQQSETPWPLPTAWSMWVRIAGHEHPAGAFTMPATSGGYSTHHAMYLPDGLETFTDIKHLDVILRPDPDAAERTVDLTEFWDGEITFSNVPVLRLQDERDR